MAAHSDEPTGNHFEPSLDAQIFYVDAYQRNTRNVAEAQEETLEPVYPRSDLGGEPYRQYTYKQLIQLCRKKDEELTLLRECVSAIKYEEARRKQKLEEDRAGMAEKAAKRYQASLDVGGFGNVCVKLSSLAPVINFDVVATEVRFKHPWPSRRVVVTGFEIVSGIYEVRTPDAMFYLEGAINAFGVTPHKSDLFGTEILLNARCYEVHPGTQVLRNRSTRKAACEDSSPRLRLEYVSHRSVLDENTVETISGGSLALVVEPTDRKILIFRNKMTDYVRWKHLLQGYLVAVHAHSRFDPIKERKKQRALIDTMRQKLLSPQLWNIDT